MWRDLLVQNKEQAKVVAFGVATDENCSIEAGAKDAPRVIRECSQFLPPVTVNGEIIEPCLYDLGDIAQYDYSQVEKYIEQCKNSKLTLILGGDHSISILTQKAYRKLNSGKVGIIHIDAHADICDEYMNSKHSHACVNRRALENGYALQDVCMLGIRSYEPQEIEFLSKNKIDVYGAERIQAEGENQIVNQIVAKYRDYDKIYLSFDIDAVDPSSAPGTGTPEHFGLSALCVKRILTRLCKELPVRVLDLVEISPKNDVNNVTTWLGLKYILEILYIFDKKGEKK